MGVFVLVPGCAAIFIAVGGTTHVRLRRQGDGSLLLNVLLYWGVLYVDLSNSMLLVADVSFILFLLSDRSLAGLEQA